MRQRLFDGVPVSEIGLGCWQLGGDQWGDMPESTAQEILETAAACSINFLDTADVYGLGRSETLIGRFLRGRNREQFFIASKFGRFPDPGWPRNFEPAVIRQHVERSLQRLGLDRLDLVQLHCLPMEQIRNPVLWDTLRQLQREGKIARFGASVESVAEARECLRQPDCRSLQIIFNIFRQTPQLSGLLEECRQRGVAVIVRLPLASGLLGGRYTPQTTFPPNDHRNFNRRGERFNVGETFAGLGFEKGLELVEKLRGIMPATIPLPQLALRWCLDHPTVTTVIPGARNAEQVQSNAAASALPPLPESLHARLRELFVSEVKPAIQGPD